MSGWEMKCYYKVSGSWVYIGTTTTNASGYYIFTGLEYNKSAEQYEIQETVKNGWQPTNPSSGLNDQIVLNPSHCYEDQADFGNKWVPDFSGTPTEGPSPLTVNFVDLSVGSSSWQWQFGDGSTSTNKNPSHTYAHPGKYTVTLTVSNAWETVTIQKVNYITVNSCISGFGNSITFNKNWKDQSVHGYMKDGTYVQVKNIYETQYDTSYIRINGETINFHYNDIVRLAIHGDQTTGDADIFSSQITRFNFYVDLYVNNLNIPYRTGDVDRIWIKKYDSYASTLAFHMPSILSSTNLVVDGTEIIPWYPLNSNIIDILNIGVPPDGQARIDLGSTDVYIDCSGNYIDCPAS